MKCRGRPLYKGNNTQARWVSQGRVIRAPRPSALTPPRTNRAPWTRWWYPLASGRRTSRGRAQRVAFWRPRAVVPERRAGRDPADRRRWIRPLRRLALWLRGSREWRTAEFSAAVYEFSASAESARILALVEGQGGEAGPGCGLGEPVSGRVVASCTPLWALALATRP